MIAAGARGLLFALTGLLAASPVVATTWTQPHVLYGGNAVAAVTFDSAGGYHGAFAPTTIVGPYGIQYKSAQGTQWVVHRGNNAAFYPEMAIAYQAGAARIVWVDSDNPDALWLSRNDTGTWASSRLWLGNAYDPQVANLGNDIAVSFEDGSGRLRYLRWDPVHGPTVPEVVANNCCNGFSMGVHGGQPSIAFATDGNVINLATRDSQGWHKNRLCSSCSGPSLAFRGAVPVLAYEHGREAWYLYRTGSTWSVPVRIFRSNPSRGQAIFKPEIVTNASGDIAAVALRIGNQTNTEPRTDILYRSIRPWGNVEAAYKGYEADEPLLTIASAPTVLYNDYCACAGGGGGGEYVIHGH